MQSMFTTLATFQYSSEAQIIKGRFLAEGIDAFLTDNYTINTDPLVSNAIGGVKLKVPTKDLSLAQEILQSISKYSLSDNGESIHCPKCQSKKVQLFTTVRDTKSFSAFVIGFLYGTLPFFTKHQYTCTKCGHNFNIDA